MPNSLLMSLRRLAALLLALQLAACAHGSTPQLDRRFGDAVHAAAKGGWRWMFREPSPARR